MGEAKGRTANGISDTVSMLHPATSANVLVRRSLNAFGQGAKGAAEAPRVTSASAGVHLDHF